MRLHKWYLLMLTTIFFISCKKAELKKPVETKIAFDLDQVNPQGVKIQQGELGVYQLDIVGDRIEGADIEFSRQYIPIISTDMNNSAEMEDFRFDLPQGEYSSLIVKVKLNPVNGKSLELEGSYKPEGSPNRKLIFSTDLSLNFELQMEGNEAVQFEKENNRKLSLVFAANDWFNQVDEALMEDAVVSIENDQPVIRINESQNTPIYQILLTAMLEGNKITVH